MNELEPVAGSCPYCGEPIELLVDCTVEMQRYVEDCSVCCRPIEVTVRVRLADGPPMLKLQRQDDA